MRRPSPLTNRVTPFGVIEAHAARYAETSVVFGNRGCLHDSAFHVKKDHATTAWLACKLRVERTRKVQREDNRCFNGRKRTLQKPGHYTELFFLDEFTALAAGHRPCACCRRDVYTRFVAAWQRAHGRSSASSDQKWAGAIDRVLHGERRESNGAKRTHPVDNIWNLPDGCMLTCSMQGNQGSDAGAWLLWQDAIHRWSHHGYVGDHVVRADMASRVDMQTIRLLTPPSIVPLLEDAASWHCGPPHESVFAKEKHATEE